MYREYFDLQEWPYRNTPDPRYIFWSSIHQQAHAMLLYALEEHDIVLLTGETGTGKTTVVRAALEEAQKTRRMTLIVLVYPRLTPFQLLASIADSLKVQAPRSRLALMNAIANELLSRWQDDNRVALVIDESQLLPGKTVFDEIRLLNNLQLDHANLIGLILVGQPELIHRLRHKAYRAFRQRIAMHIDLQPLLPKEIGPYMLHRWNVAGGHKFPFPDSAIERIAKLSQGIPRLINHLAHLSLMEAYGRNQKTISEEIINTACASIML